MQYDANSSQSLINIKNALDIEQGILKISSQYSLELYKTIILDYLEKNPKIELQALGQSTVMLACLVSKIVK